MSEFFLYLRNITYYLIFAALVGMLAPAGKYKKFVSLVMGFILLSVMISPLAHFVPQIPVTQWFEGLGDTGDSFDLQYSQWRNTYFKQEFERQLYMQLETLLTQNGFKVHDLAFTFSEDLTQIGNVIATVSKEETPERIPFIRIQPIQVGAPNEAEPCSVSISAKNLISQFYNLEEQHITVIVR